jgi:two-component system chemotaxis response regulator CheY
MKVLVVDDSNSMVEYMRITLSDLRVGEILVARSGQEALEIYANNLDIDMIFTDWNMPNMDGIKFIKKVRVIDSTNSIYITMVTTECKKIKVIEALDAGADNYVVKPFSKKRLQSIIDDFYSKNEKELALVV